MYPTTATQFQIQDINEIHLQATKNLKQHDATDHALKQQLLGTVDDMFINVLSDTHVGYVNVTNLQLLTYLYSTYANITEGGLEDNKDAMAAP